MEYRVYAEDPSRKFLPSIGFLRKYQEPVYYNEPEKRVRIDTGVEEGSEISMYYDPMISKLITWGPDRQKSIDILDRAFDEYVIQGVTHNLGFGKSILANEAYKTGDYSTAFIPTYYPEGFTGDNLDNNDHTLLGLAAHKIKNIHLGWGERDPQSKQEKVFYMTIDELRDQPEVNMKVEFDGEVYKVTDLASGSVQEISVEDFKYDNNSLVNLKYNGSEKLLQFENR